MLKLKDLKEIQMDLSMEVGEQLDKVGLPININSYLTDCGFKPVKKCIITNFDKLNKKSDYTVNYKTINGLMSAYLMNNNYACNIIISKGYLYSSIINISESSLVYANIKDVNINDITITMLEELILKTFNLLKEEVNIYV